MSCFLLCGIFYLFLKVSVHSRASLTFVCDIGGLHAPEALQLPLQFSRNLRASISWGTARGSLCGSCVVSTPQC